jgi:1,4-dihydroxy-2-naphthoate octaprenyltransferase
MGRRAITFPPLAADAGVRRFWIGVWRIVDPKITLASAASCFVGAAAAAAAGPIEWGWLALAALGLVFLEAAKNASGELFDYASGADAAVAAEDRSPFSGGKRVLVDGLLTSDQVRVLATLLYGLGIAAGLAIAFFREPGVLWFGLAGVGLAYSYHAPPLRLAYRGLGEIAVALGYGPGIACGVHVVLRHEWTAQVALVSVPLGILIAAFLWINELPDFAADRGAGKRTLVVRMGRRRASRVFAALQVVGYATLLLLPAAGLPSTSWLGLAGLPFGAAAAARVLTWPERTERIVPAQRWTLLGFVAAAAGIGLGQILGAAR